MAGATWGVSESMGKDKKTPEESSGNGVREQWRKIDSQNHLSTRQKLEKLVAMKFRQPEVQKTNEPDSPAVFETPYLVLHYSYPLDSRFGGVKLADWQAVSSKDLAVLAGDDLFREVDPLRLLYFDVETTGLAGGTGTIPFMLGFGAFDSGGFSVTVFVLNDLTREGEFIEAVDAFLAEREYEGTVTYNGKCFDFPLMETRYILHRRRFMPLQKPHLDFLFPARTLWKYTYGSRKLSYLGDILLGISRDEDVDPSQIPSLYFSYLRSGRFSLLEKVVEHNALDLVGLSSLLLLAVRYLEDRSLVADEGEILGTAMLYEKWGDLGRAGELLEIVRQTARRDEVLVPALKRLAAIKKKKKMYAEALELWSELSGFSDRFALRELSIHHEHRLKDFNAAVEYAVMALETLELTPAQRRDLEKRLTRLRRKLAALGPEDES